MISANGIVGFSDRRCSLRSFKNLTYPESKMLCVVMFGDTEIIECTAISEEVYTTLPVKGCRGAVKSFTTFLRFFPFGQPPFLGVPFSVFSTPGEGASAENRQSPMLNRDRQEHDKVIKEAKTIQGKQRLYINYILEWTSIIELPHYKIVKLSTQRRIKEDGDRYGAFILLPLCCSRLRQSIYYAAALREVYGSATCCITK